MSQWTGGTPGRRPVRRSLFLLTVAMGGCGRDTHVDANAWAAASVSEAQTVFLPHELSPNHEQVMVIASSKRPELRILDRHTWRAVDSLILGELPLFSTWSPDGHTIAFFADSGGAALHLRLWNLTAHSVAVPDVPLLPRVNTPLPYAWSPSGDQRWSEELRQVG